MISIIIPVYNLEKYIPKCLDSLINQTYNNIEIICVNDGSSDNSLQVLNEYAQKDSRIKVINQKNQGVSVARNVGIDNATGDYIIFVDGDDWIDLDTCEYLMEYMSQSNADLLYFNNRNVYKNGRCYNPCRLKLDNLVASNLFENFENKKFILNNLSCFRFLYKSKFILDNNAKFIEDLSCGEDNIFVLSLLCTNPKIVCIPQTFYNYYLGRENSLMKVDRYEWFLKQKIFLDKVKSLFLDNNIEFKSLEKTFLDYAFAGVVQLWEPLGLNNHKNEFFEYIDNFYKIYNSYSEQELVYARGYKKYKRYKLLSKLHLIFFYHKLIRPIGKYCFILPYRRLENFIRQKTEGIRS